MSERAVVYVGLLISTAITLALMYLLPPTVMTVVTVAAVVALVGFGAFLRWFTE